MARLRTLADALTVPVGLQSALGNWGLQRHGGSHSQCRFAVGPKEIDRCSRMLMLVTCHRRPIGGTLRCKKQKSASDKK